MTGVVPAIPKLQFHGPAGTPLANGTLTTYRAGSTTPATTWQDQPLAIPNANPIVLDARGECLVWLDSAVTYKFVLKNALGATVWTVDNVSGTIGSGVFKSPATEKQTATAGQTVFNLATVSYDVGSNNLEVFVNGLKLLTGTDFAESSSTSVTLTSGLAAGDEIEFLSGGRLTSSASEDPASYQYPASGTVPTTVNAKLDSLAANPEDWGALGDGVTDDTAAFQLAINWLQSSGAAHMQLALGAKAYRIAGTLRITGALHLRGEGYVDIEPGRPITRPAKGSWLIHASTTGPLLQYSGNLAKGGSITDLAIFQEGHPAPAPGWAPAPRDWVIRNENTEGTLAIDRVHFHNVYRGVLTDNSYRPRFGRISGQFFYRGFTFDRIFDTGTFEDLHAWTFWSEDTSVLQWTQANGVAITLQRVDGLAGGSFFTFALAQTLYCGPSTATTGGARVVNIDRIYSDFCGRAIVVDNGVTHVTVDSLFHLGQAWPGSPVAALPGSCGVHVVSGTNTHLQVGTYYGVLCEGASVKVEGSANQVTIESPIFEQYDKSASGAGPIAGLAGNQVYLGNVPQAINYAGVTTALVTGGAAVVIKAPLAQQYVGGAATNKVVAAANGPGQLAVITTEGEANAGITLQASGTGPANVGAPANTLAFFGGGASVKQTVTGACAGNTALKNLLTALAAHGLLVDSTTA